MKRDADFFADRELDLIYIAKKLRDALKLEAALTEGEVEYAVEVENYVGGVLFRAERAGAFFYVLPEDWDRAAGLMQASRFKVRERVPEAET